MNTSWLLGLIVALVIAGLLFWLVIWFVDWVGLPEPFNKVVKVLVGLVVLLYVASILLGGVSPPMHYWVR